MSAASLNFLAAHPSGMGGVEYAVHDGEVTLVTCGQDGHICIRKADDPAEITKTAQAEGAAGHCLAVSKVTKQFAVGDQGHFVKVYKLPDGSFDSVGTRFSLPVRALSYSPSGTNLAAGGDDEGIKLISASESKVFRTLRAGPYTRSLAYDPESDFLASMSAEGTLQIWDMADGKAKHTQKKAAPKVDVTSALRNGIAWHPDGGSLLAVPGTENDITMFERLSWSVAFSLKGPHSAPINLVSFSPNGLYLLSAGTDQLMVLWDVIKRKPICQRKTPATVSAVSWHPSDNQVACISEEGSIAIWAGLVPEDLPGPHVSPDSLHKEGSLKDGEGERGGSVDPLGASNDGDDAMDSFIDQDMEDDMAWDTTAPGSGNKKRRGSRYAPSHVARMTQPQDSFQSGATTLDDTSQKRFMAYNALGCVICKEDEDWNVIEVSMHDSRTQRRRVPHLNDLYRFSMAALGDKGVLYASPSSKDAPSMLLYSPFDSWAANSDWQMSLPEGEEATAVAAGQTFCAVATSRRMLRMFSQAGLQTFISTLEGPAVALAAQNHLLAVVWHAACPGNNDDQLLHYAVYDVSEQQQVHAGSVVLSPTATLTWLSFTDEGLLATYDSEGVLRVRTAGFGGSWVPVFVSAQQRKNSETYWPVSLTLSTLNCIVCKSNQPEPQVVPRPVMTSVALHMPVLNADAPSAALEADLLRQNLHLTHLRLQITELTDAGEDPSQAQQDLVAGEVTLDRCLLKLFNLALRADKLQQALEAACQLHQQRALEGAIQLANHNRQPALSDRIATFLQNRLDLEAADAEEMMSPQPAAVESAYQQAEPSASAASPSQQEMDSSPVQATPKLAGSAGTALRKPLLPTGNSLQPHSNRELAAKNTGKRKAQQAPSANPFARSKTAKS